MKFQLKKYNPVMNFGPPGYANKMSQLNMSSILNIKSAQNCKDIVVDLQMAILMKKGSSQKNF